MEILIRGLWRGVCAARANGRKPMAAARHRGAVGSGHRGGQTGAGCGRGAGPRAVGRTARENQNALNGHGGGPRLPSPARCAPRGARSTRSAAGPRARGGSRSGCLSYFSSVLPTAQLTTSSVAADGTPAHLLARIGVSLSHSVRLCTLALRRPRRERKLCLCCLFYRYTRYSSGCITLCASF